MERGQQNRLVAGCRSGQPAKFYAATQTIDEARHAELYARFLQEKIGVVYPISEDLKSLLNSTLADSRWDMPHLGMQVLIEGLALAAFGALRDVTTAGLLPWRRPSTCGFTARSSCPSHPPLTSTYALRGSIAGRRRPLCVRAPRISGP